MIYQDGGSAGLLSVALANPHHIDRGMVATLTVSVNPGAVPAAV
jgi:hypothetical protein